MAVVGAGVVGLSTALNIQQRLPIAHVTLIADKFTKDTTSHGAGGLFRPNVDHVHGVDPDTIRRWSVEAFKFYSDLATSPEAADTGHMIMPGYVFSHTEIKNPLYKELVYSFRELTQDEIRKLGVQYEYGYQVTTVITDMAYYLPWLMTRFKENGGTLLRRKLGSFEELVGSYDIVVNCCGIGSTHVVSDKVVYPVRGHLIKVKAPWIKSWVYTDDEAYFIPSRDYVSLGGIRQKGNWSREIDVRDSRGILERCYKLWPSLKKAPIVSEWVDLRPHRDPIRIEVETMSFPSGSLKVVHNYGHGAVGVTLSWGTAIDAANLVLKTVNQSKL